MKKKADVRFYSFFYIFFILKYTLVDGVKSVSNIANVESFIVRPRQAMVFNILIAQRL